ncbi:MAG: group 1 glycosyl transferase [Parcubacteria group bacterium Athens1014_26]|nr:MAG: group 1 glycosyl transferase [Parcubacteria group bacterium Athens1014_26]
MDIAVEVSEGLVKRGHKVDFYGPEGTKVKVTNIVSAGLKALNQPEGESIIKRQNVGNAEVNKIFNLWDQYLIAKMFAEAEKGNYDLLHIHPLDRALPLALSHPKVPVFYTLHDPIYPWRAEIFSMFSSPNQHYISISDAQRKPAPDLNYAATIYNGTDTDTFLFSEEHDNYLLFVGRLQPEKGVAEAVQVAKMTGEKLLIIGPPVTGEYWDKKIAPYLGDKIQYLGFVPRQELFKYYQRAKATLVPIQWEEPFGLILTESMACGTPVIAFDRGSVSEIVVEGKTGFIIKDNNLEAMADAVKKIDKIKRIDCRRRVEQNFSIQRMIDHYEEVFLKTIS